MSSKLIMRMLFLVILCQVASSVYVRGAPSDAAVERMRKRSVDEDSSLESDESASLSVDSASLGDDSLSDSAECNEKEFCVRLDGLVNIDISGIQARLDTLEEVTQTEVGKRSVSASESAECDEDDVCASLDSLVNIDIPRIQERLGILGGGRLEIATEVHKRSASDDSSSKSAECDKNQMCATLDQLANNVIPDILARIDILEEVPCNRYAVLNHCLRDYALNLHAGFSDPTTYCATDPNNILRSCFISVTSRCPDVIRGLTEAVTQSIEGTINNLLCVPMQVSCDPGSVVTLCSLNYSFIITSGFNDDSTALCASDPIKIMRSCYEAHTLICGDHINIFADIVINSELQRFNTRCAGQ